MHPDVEKCLVKGGWNEHRRVPVDHWAYWMGRFGVTMVPGAVTILHNLGGLLIPTLPVVPPGMALSGVFFDPLYDWGHYGDVLDLQAKLGRRTTPIGVCHDFDGAVVVSEDNQFFRTYFGDIRRIGHSLDEALQHLLCGIGEPIEFDVAPRPKRAGWNRIFLKPQTDGATGLETKESLQACQTIFAIRREFLYEA